MRPITREDPNLIHIPDLIPFFHTRTCPKQISYQLDPESLPSMLNILFLEFKAIFIEIFPSSMLYKTFLDL